MAEIEVLNNKLSEKTKYLDELAETSSTVSESYDRVQTNYASLQQDYTKLFSEKLAIEESLAQKTKIIDALTQQIAELEAAIVELGNKDHVEESETLLRPIEVNSTTDTVINTETPDNSIANITVVPVETEAPNLDVNDDEPAAPNAAFGTKFPANPGKGDLFLRVDYLPSRLYKWNDSKWIEIDKAITDSYTYDEAYIKFLITKLASGDYDTDDLSEAEQEQVTEYLKLLPQIQWQNQSGTRY